MGWLAETYPMPLDRAFKARSLIYAERMAEHYGQNPWSRWHRAYAMAACGLHDKAAYNITQADKVAAASQKKEHQRPQWADLINSYCRFSIDDLQPDTAPPSQRQLAYVLRMSAIELANGIMGESQRVQTVETTSAVIDAMPECYRAYDALCDHFEFDVLGDVPLNAMLMFAKQIYSRVNKIEGMPEEICGYAGMKSKPHNIGQEEISVYKPTSLSGEEFTRRARLIGALRYSPLESSTTSTVHEPSLAVLGRLIEETSFAQVMRLVQHAGQEMNIGTDHYVDATKVFTKQHPLPLARLVFA